MYIIIDSYSNNQAVIRQTKDEVDQYLRTFPMSDEEIAEGTLRVFLVEEELYREYDSESEEGNRYD